MWDTPQEDISIDVKEAAEQELVGESAVLDRIVEKVYQWTCSNSTTGVAKAESYRFKKAIA